jgi:hypothetical protein
LTFTFAPLGPVDAKVALVAGSIDGWAVWEPYVSHATLKDNARIVADGEGLTPTITFIQAIATKRAAVQDLVQRLNKAHLWSLDHLPEYAKKHCRPDQTSGRRFSQRLHRAAPRSDRHRCRHHQGAAGGVRPRERRGRHRMPAAF